MDLERFYLWLEDTAGQQEAGGSRQIGKDTSVSDEMEAYLEYLSREKGLRDSTICRKKRVFGIYLTYLATQGILKQYDPLKPVNLPRENTEDTLLTKNEADRFFRAIDREYEELDSDFRRRVCLRDQVMMKILFFHGIEVSELLRLELTDYDKKEALLMVKGKRGKIRSVKIFSRILQRQMEEWLEEHEWFEHDDSYQNRMFLSKFGRPLSMKMIINIFDKYRGLAEIEKECKPKDLKNSLSRYAREMVMELEK
ncbi:MAG: tyrosine-type recombinase/integrase [Hungatella sp.]|nr:tyrosine-type recombinase/integrase [Hungatella sp.]